MTLTDAEKQLADRPAAVDPRPSAHAEFVRAVARCATWVVGTFLWAFLCDYVLNESTFVGKRDSAYITTTYVWIAGLAVDGLAAGTLFIWVVIVLVWAVTGKTWLALALSLNTAVLLGAVNAAKLRVRAEPLYPSDVDFLRNPRFLLDMTTPGTLVLAGAAMLLLMLAIRSVSRRVMVGTTAPRVWRNRRSQILGRVITGLVCATLVVSASGFNNDPHNGWRAVFDADVARWAHWSQHENFMKNGYVAGTLYDMPISPMPEPEGYSRQRMDQIVDTYSDAAAGINAGRRVDALDDVNVISVLSESFSDPTALAGPTLEADPIPVTRAVMSANTSGRLLVAGLGGGTANVEFEALTGMSQSFLAPQLTTPFQQLVPKAESFPSMVSWFGAHGHDTLAVHPFSGEMYQRQDVYPRLGFDEFVDAGDMQPTSRSSRGEFIDDATAFDEVLFQLNAHEQPLYTHLVTMQNHLPYEGQYDDPYAVSGVTTGVGESIGQYARGLTISDDALDEFLARLRTLPEKTAVVFFGDHLPGIYPSEIAGRNGERLMHETPFFIWKNFGEPSPDQQPSVSPNQLLPLLLDGVDARVPPYVALLDRVRDVLPAVQQGMYVLPDDSSEPVTGQLSPDTEHLLEDYRLVQYDLVVGHRWSEAGLFGLDTSQDE